MTEDKGVWTPAEMKVTDHVYVAPEYTAAIGTYRKIGNVVLVEIPPQPFGDGEYKITGLPFSSKASD
jgi:hypothetical protein